MKYRLTLLVACALASFGATSVTAIAKDYPSGSNSTEGQFIDGMPILHDIIYPDNVEEQTRVPLRNKAAGKAPVEQPYLHDAHPADLERQNESSSPDSPRPEYGRPGYTHPDNPYPEVSRPETSYNGNNQHVVSAVPTIPGMPPVIDANDLYSETEGVDKLSPVVKNHLRRVYVPNLRSDTVSVIDPSIMKVVETLKVGHSPQHVVPSWDLRTLWVTNNAERRTDGSLTPIDPVTGKTGKSVPVDDPYNLYFTPDGKSAIVVAEARQRLDFRDPHTMKHLESLTIPACKGINHAAFSIDGRYAIFTCEFGRYLAKVDTVHRKLMGILHLSKGGMPQDILVSRNGRRFYVADMIADGVFIIDGDSFKEVGFIYSGPGTHGLYPSRDGKMIYATNRGSHAIHGRRHSPGSISVISADTEKVITRWPVPGGGSPDMGNVSADGKTLWISGRFDDVVYAINTQNGHMKEIPVGMEPHGLTVWPQPGRYSVGHTGIMR